MGFYMLENDNRKKEFVGLRMESEKLIELKNEAQQLGIDLSTLIRRKL